MNNVPYILKSGNYGGYLEIYTASKVFKISIYIYEFIEAESKYRLLHNFNSEIIFFIFYDFKP